MKGTGTSCTAGGAMDDMICFGAKVCSTVANKPPFPARRT